MIKEEMRSALQGAFPSVIATYDDNNVPNVSYISQVYYVDEKHVAISNQFFNKSIRNIKSNGMASVNVIKPDDFKSWYLYLKHVDTKTEGELFDDMSMQLEAIASMVGMEGVFKLHASEIFEVYRIDAVITS